MKEKNESVMVSEIRITSDRSNITEKELKSKKEAAANADEENDSLGSDNDSWDSCSINESK